MTKTLREKVTAAYVLRFGDQPALLVRAPGRVNLIGEHTDYNGGFVFPMAIDREIWIALTPRIDDRVEVYSADLEEDATFAIGSIQKSDQRWVEYIKGVAWVLADQGHQLKGWKGAVTGNIPRGAGLSSSAALEVATVMAFTATSGLDLTPTQRALIAQRAENQWVGMNCGIMDQLISAAGKAGHALLIDCRSLDIKPAPLPANSAVVIMDTATRRGLVDSAYNERRSQCETAAKFFGAELLRDVSSERLQSEAAGLDPLTHRRAAHVISENERTEAFAAALGRADATEAGRLMNASHASLRDLFEVSCPELDAMAAIAQANPHCWGARMTGAGFGGCAVALVKAEAVDTFIADVEEKYVEATGKSPHFYVCQPTAGAAILDF